MSDDRDDIPKGIRNRFRNLDFDDEPRPRPRPKARPKAPPAAVEPPPRAPARPAPPARRPAEAIPRPIAAPAPPGPALSRVGLRLQRARDPSEGRVRVEEVTWGAATRVPVEPSPPGPLPALQPGAPWPARDVGWASDRDGPPPITIEREAARQLRLIAHRAGAQGCGLRILTSGSRALPDCDFTFEEVADPEDVVVETQGIRLYLDPISYALLEGVRITWDDLPGLSGFAFRRRGD